MKPDWNQRQQREALERAHVKRERIAFEAKQARRLVERGHEATWAVRIVSFSRETTLLFRQPDPPVPNQIMLALRANVPWTKTRKIINKVRVYFPVRVD